MKFGRAPTTWSTFIDCRLEGKSACGLPHYGKLLARVARLQLRNGVANVLRARQPLLDARHEDARQTLGAERARARARPAPDAEDVRLAVRRVRGREHVVELPEPGRAAVDAAQRERRLALHLNAQESEARGARREDRVHMSQRLGVLDHGGELARVDLVADHTAHAHDAGGERGTGFDELVVIELAN